MGGRRKRLTKRRKEDEGEGEELALLLKMGMFDIILKFDVFLKENLKYGYLLYFPFLILIVHHSANQQGR